ncbi:MAG: FKBP-type peptidyl-prolyl cis-trans isomerase [Proteobacteria bacterium]|nr:MAG: FKBP-type peptidyl-prolyl cis-trans isomerase [Pseudomonadota bacterium]
MKSIIALALVAVVGLVGCEKKAKIETDQEKASYAIGQQIGRSLKMQNADVVVPSLVAGMNDAIGDKEAKLKPEEMQAALQKMQEGAMKKAMEEAEKNQKIGDDWLAKNKTADGWKSTESGLQYKVEKEGSGSSPKESDTVKVHYTGTLIDGKKFDSSRDRNEPAEFPVNGVIPGWTEALKMMKPGAQWKLAIPAKLAYGPQGRPGIPPNSTLQFDVELLEVKGAAAPEKKK